MQEKNWCAGEGRLVRPKEPSHLVDCEICGRRNLSGLVGVHVGADGWLILPKHTAAAFQYCDVERATRLNEERIRLRSSWMETEI